MKVELTKREIRCIKHALYLATQWELTSIDSFTVQYARGKEACRKPKVVPAEYRPTVRRSRASIQNWKKIELKLQTNMKHDE